MILNITNDNFEQEVLGAKEPVLLVFWRENDECAEELQGVIEAVENRLSDTVKIGKVNVDADVALAFKYQIFTTPTMIVMKLGLFSGKAAGMMSPQEIISFLDL